MKWKGVRRSCEGGEDVARLLALKAEEPCVRNAVTLAAGKGKKTEMLLLMGFSPVRVLFDF